MNPSHLNAEGWSVCGHELQKSLWQPYSLKTSPWRERSVRQPSTKPPPLASPYLPQLVVLPGVGILQDLALRVGPLQLSPQALDLLLQPQAAVAAVALLVVGQLLFQLLHLHGVSGGDCRQLLRQCLEFFVLWRANRERGEEVENKVIWPGKKTTQRRFKKETSKVESNLTITACLSAFLASP